MKLTAAQLKARPVFCYENWELWCAWTASLPKKLRKAFSGLRKPPIPDHLLTK